MGKAYIGTLQVAYPIESISRKLALRSEKAENKKLSQGGDSSHQVIIPGTKYMGGMVRSNYVVTGNGKSELVKTQYLFIRKNARESAVTDAEIAQRTIFAEVSPAVAALKKNLSQISKMQRMFLESRDDNNKTVNRISAKGYDYAGWIFAVQYAGRKASSSYDLTKFPDAFDN